MVAKTDYSTKSRFRTDPGFKIYTMDGLTIASPIMMRTPIRSSSDQIYTVELKYQFRWDVLANDLLGAVELRWVLMRHNAIANPFYGPVVGQRLLVPTSSQVDYYLNNT